MSYGIVLLFLPAWVQADSFEGLQPQKAMNSLYMWGHTNATCAPPWSFCGDVQCDCWRCCHTLSLGVVRKLLEHFSHASKLHLRQQCPRQRCQVASKSAAPLAEPKPGIEPAHPLYLALAVNASLHRAAHCQQPPGPDMGSFWDPETALNLCRQHLSGLHQPYDQTEVAPTRTIQSHHSSPPCFPQP